ncbi:MAG: AAA family ATPase [Candidatus Omnitrophica bacterium]|nr:AAA family ATPase [Candidatus Omnitrophota bacterium]
MPKKNKLTIFWRLYWIRILVVTAITLLAISVAIMLYRGINEWGSIDAITKQHTIASFPFQFFVMIISVFFFGLMWIVIGRGGIGGGGMSFLKPVKAPVRADEIKVHWNDFIGMEDVRQEAEEVVRLIRDRTAFERSGAGILKGVLLLGPPGCGKTYLVKAIATETDLPFLSVSGSEFTEMYVGVGAGRVRRLFKQARELASLEGGCIIFIDEIDAVATARVLKGRAGHEERNSTLNQLLVEMDGLRGRTDNIVVFGATNMAEQLLDTALLRPGRFDRKIVVGLPDNADRRKIFEYYLSKVNHDNNSIDLDKLARATVGASPAEIANIVQEAVIITQRNRKTKLTLQEINEARERISLGIKRKFTMTAEEKKRLAFYEAGHILVAYLLVPTKDVFKATIIPRGEDIVSTFLTEKEEVLSQDKNLLLAELRIALAGHACEKVKLGVTSNIADKDLKKATELAHNMVWRWGMGKSGHVGCFDDRSVTHLIAESLDRDLDELITSCIEEINLLLRENWNIVEAIAQELIAKEELDYDQIEEIFKKFGKTRPDKEVVKIQEKKIIKTGVNWDDVIGMEETKQEAHDLVELIKDRARLQKVGGRIIKGMLMFGPPGCGKTYLASAMATEFGLPFLYKSGSEFIEMYVGVGAMRIRRMFIEARELARVHGGCIIFLDEIDAVGGRRSSDRGSGGQAEHNQTLNQLLVEMDGLKEKYNDYNIVVIGATNMPEEHFDQALLRPGRFDRKIYIYPPAEEERKQLFEYYLSKLQYDKQSVNIEKLARVTVYYSAADIANLIHEAAILCVRNKKECLGIAEISEAQERIELGLRRKIKQLPQEKEATAYHEAGHAIVTYLCQPKKDSFKLSIVPRMRSLGVSISGRSESAHFSKKEALSDIMCSLGGYAAEKIKYDNTGAGVSSDFERALTVAHSMVYNWGMGESGYLGNFDALCMTSRSDEQMISESMKAKLDEDVQKILHDCLKETEALLTRERPLMDKLSAELLQKEELNHDQIEEIFRSFGKSRPLSY